MGTRSLIIIYFNGQYVVAQYTQFDGYPEGQGLDILKFFNKDPDKLRALKDKMHVVYEISQAEADSISKKMYQIDAEKQSRGEYVQRDQNAMYHNYPSLSEVCGAKILDLIIEAREDKKYPTQILLNEVTDYLFIEWAYVIDLDTDKLEVYSGYEEKEGARSQRFVELWSQDGKHKNEMLAGRPEVPRMLCDFSLINPPTEKEFLSHFDKDQAAEYEDSKDNEDEDDKDDDGEDGDGEIRSTEKVGSGPVTTHA